MDPQKDVLQYFDKATDQFKLCKNRVWAVAKRDLPELLPRHFVPIPGHEQHEQCTFEFCQHSQRDFTAVKQRHECQDGNCRRLRYIFSRATLEEAAVSGKSTVWHLDGTSMIEPPAPYMAISHVWSDGTGTGAWPDGQVNECLYAFFHDIAMQYQCCGIWWDTLCIPKGKEARSRAIANIPNYYQEARITLVHDCFLRNYHWDEETACFAILVSPWFSRGWTAVELAKSRKVKIIVKGPCGPLIKDLDQEILAKESDPGPSPRKAASDIIRNLRKGSMQLDDLLAVLESRHTSWPKDMATIAALLGGVAPQEFQQDTYKAILRKTGRLSHENLFHNSATLSTPSWCPTNLLNMPNTSNAERALRIEENWEISGLWRVIPVRDSLYDMCVWNNSHTLIKEKAREALAAPDTCRLLVEPGVKSAERALLVACVGEELPEKDWRCLYVAALFFHPAMLKRYAEGFGPGALKPVHIRLVGDVVAAQEAGLRSLPTVVENAGQDQSQMQSLITAAAAGDKDTVIKLLNWQPELANLKDPGSHRTALHYATWRGYVEVLEVLLEKRARADLGDKRGQTPLHLAAERGEERMVYLLLKSMPDDESSATLEATCSYGQTALHRAAWGGSVRVIENLLTAGSSTTASDHDGHTALHIAAEMGFGTVAELLLRKGSTNVHQKSRNGLTPLHYAAMYGHETVARLLLDTQADVKRTDDNIGWTPLHLAAMNGHVGVMQQLVARGADVRAADYKLGWEPLHMAAMNDQEMASCLLLKEGADCKAPDQTGWTPLHIAEIKGRGVQMRHHVDDSVIQLDNLRWTELHLAAMNGPKTIAKLLLRPNSTTNMRAGNAPTPLLHAASRGYDNTVRIILTIGADIEARDRFGRTALQFAAANERQTIARLLLDKGALIDAKDQDGQTALFLAARRGDGPIVGLLLERGARVDGTDCHGTSPLLVAAMNGHEAIVQMLLDKNANLNAKNSNGWAPLYEAALYGNPASVRMLLDKGANVDAEDVSGLTPLFVSAMHGNEAIMRLLLDKGANINVQDHNGNTLLHKAVQKKDVAFARLLLDMGIDTEKRDQNGKTPLRQAATSSNKDFLLLLVQKGADINTQDNNGMTPLQDAAMRDDTEMISLLLGCNADTKKKNRAGWSFIDIMHANR